MHYADRVKQLTVTTGLGDYSISSLAVAGFATWAEAIPDGAQVGYCAQSLTNYEVGIGIYTAATNSLSRDTILASSNEGAAVDWASGSKDVFCTVPAGALPTYSNSNPTVSSNPVFVGAEWINIVNAERFICTDKTGGANQWVGSLGTLVGDALPKPLSAFTAADSIGAVVQDQIQNRNIALTGAVVSDISGVPHMIFDGINDHGLIATKLKTLKNFTYSIWFRWVSGRGLLFQDTNIVIRVGGTDKTIIWDNRDRIGPLKYVEFASSGIAADSALHNLIISSAELFYHNGGMVTPEISASTAANAFSEDRVGAFSTGATVIYGGVSVAKIDIFDTALTAGQMVALYSAGI